MGPIRCNTLLEQKQKWDTPSITQRYECNRYENKFEEFCIQCLNPVTLDKLITYFTGSIFKQCKAVDYDYVLKSYF